MKCLGPPGREHVSGLTCLGPPGRQGVVRLKGLEPRRGDRRMVLLRRRPLRNDAIEDGVRATPRFVRGSASLY